MFKNATKTPFKMPISLFLFFIIILLTVLPLVVNKNGEFNGADGLAKQAILDQNTEYEPWFEPIFEPKSSEIESLIFALQASTGTGIIMFIFGFWIGKGQIKKTDQAKISIKETEKS